MAEWRWPLEQNCMERELVSAKLFPKTVEISSFFFFWELRLLFFSSLLLSYLCTFYLLWILSRVLTLRGCQGSWPVRHLLRYLDGAVPHEAASSSCCSFSPITGPSFLLFSLVWINILLDSDSISPLSFGSQVNLMCFYQWMNAPTFQMQ